MHINLQSQKLTDKLSGKDNLWVPPKLDDQVVSVGERLSWHRDASFLNPACLVQPGPRRGRVATNPLVLLEGALIASIK
jgi:hypothetical protein